MPDRKPFLTFYTPTFRRPEQLARCYESVRRQTHVQLVEQITVVDHLGVGVAGAFAAVPAYVGAVHGEYVHFLCDDDVLASETVVGKLWAAAMADGMPHVIVVGSQKPGGYYPSENHGPPVLGSIDLGCLVVRGDVWRAHAHLYGRRYEGDYDFAAALWDREWNGERLRWAWHRDLHFVTGAASRGRYEGQWP